MKWIPILIIVLSCMRLEACVTYDKNTDTYTVDSSGSVDNGTGIDWSEYIPDSE